MYRIERIEFKTVTGCWEYRSFEEAKQQWIRLNESPHLYPLLTVDGEPYTIAQAERLFSVKQENKKRFGWGELSFHRPNDSAFR